MHNSKSSIVAMNVSRLPRHVIEVVVTFPLAFDLTFIVGGARRLSGSRDSAMALHSLALIHLIRILILIGQVTLILSGPVLR